MHRFRALKQADFVVPFIGIWGSFASFLGIIFTLKPASTTLSTGDTLWILGLLAVCLWATYLVCRRIPRLFDTIEEINEYLYSWISKPGQVAICTRDLSWGSAPKIRELLIQKAINNELSILLPEPTPLTLDLKEKGAKIYSYEELDYKPIARFTIIHAGTDYARVAIGRKLPANSQHYIEEYSYGSAPMFSVAQDLYEILKRYNEKVKNKV